MARTKSKQKRRRFLKRLKWKRRIKRKKQILISKSNHLKKVKQEQKTEPPIGAVPLGQDSVQVEEKPEPSVEQKEGATEGDIK